MRQLRHRLIRIGPPKYQAIAFTTMALSVAILIAALIMPIWLPRAIRRLVPDRYIVAYAPTSLQAIIFQRYTTGEVLPPISTSHSVSSNSQAQKLLQNDALAPIALAPAAELIPATPTWDMPATAPPALPTSFALKGFSHTYQGWNNCGPATLTTTLSYWGIDTTQQTVANFVKPNPEDRNVRPDELAAFAESVGQHAIVRVDGNVLLLKRFIAAGFPPIIEQGFEVEKLGWMGHYIVLTAYSDETQTFTAQDSYLGPNRKYAYADVEKYWWHFNRTYLVLYRADQAAEIMSIIGPDVDNSAMWNGSLRAARDALRQNADDAFGWFNLGSSLVALGNFEDAAVAFDQAQTLGLPWRMLWYQFGPYEAYLAVGRYDDLQALADISLADNIYSEEAYFYKGKAFAAQGRIPEARAQFELALLYNKHYIAAQQALAKLGY